MPHAEAAPTANSRSGYAETVKSSGVKSEHTRGGEGGTAWCQLLSLLPASRSLTYQSGWRHKLALWGWDHKKNTHSTVARYGQGMRSWLCSQGNADLPPPKTGTHRSSRHPQPQTQAARRPHWRWGPRRLLVLGMAVLPQSVGLGQHWGSFPTHEAGPSVFPPQGTQPEWKE